MNDESMSTFSFKSCCSLDSLEACWFFRLVPPVSIKGACLLLRMNDGVFFFLAWGMKVRFGFYPKLARLLT